MSILNKISYSIGANIINLLVSSILVMVMPKMMTMEDYSMWQLFLFYFSYVGFLHLGWLDGIYLRYGGISYEKIQKDIFSTQLILFCIFLIIEIVALNIYILFYSMESNLYIVFTVSIAAFFMNIIWFSSYILQLTGKMKEYFKIIVFQKSSTLIIIIIFVLLQLLSYKHISMVTVLSLMLTSIYGIIIIKDIIFPISFKLYDAIKEIYNNIVIGFKLMIANISSSLMLGVTRYAVSDMWGIIVFGKISFSLGISSFLMVFINAVSIVLFPILRNIDDKHYNEIYNNVRLALSSIFIILLLLYYPIYNILSLWLPNYKDSLDFMGILFPLCLLESKVQLLTNVFLKTLRMEDFLLKINVISLIFAMITTYISVYVLADIYLLLYAIIINSFFKLFISELNLSKIININMFRIYIWEIFIILSFIIINIKYFCFGIYFYCIIVIIYIINNINKLIKIYSQYKYTSFNKA